MRKRIGVCLPVRPLKGQEGYDNPDRWGCLRPDLHSSIWDILNQQENVNIVQADFRDAILNSGRVICDGTDLGELDGLFWYCEIDRNPGSFHLQVLKTLATQIPVYPDPWKWEVAVDKYTAHECLEFAGIVVPDFLLFEIEQLPRIEPIFSTWNGAMLKPRRGAWGKGVHLVEDYAALRDLTGYIRSVTGTSPDQGYLLERYLDNDMDQWVSITVIGGEVMYGYRKRKSKVVAIGNGKFKVYDVNEKGGEVDYINPSPQQREIALKAAEALGCPIIGFDMIWTSDGAIIVDENTSPGNYMDIYQLAGKDPAQEFSRMILSHFP